MSGVDARINILTTAKPDLLLALQKKLISSWKEKKNNTGSEIGNSDSNRPRWITKDAEMYHFTLCTSADTHILRTYNWSTTGTTIYNCVVRKMSPHKSFYCWQNVQRSSFGRFFVFSPFNGKSFLARSTKKRTNERWHKKKYLGAIWPNLLGSMKPAERSSFGNGWWTSDTHNTNGWAKYSKGIGKAVYTVGNEYSSDECNINVSTSQQ